LTTINLDQAADFFDPKKFRTAALRGVRKAAARGLRVAQTQIIPARVPQPVDRGIYRASWKTQVIPNGAEIYTDAPHSPFIENGVRAESVKIGPMILSALTEWIIRKGIAKQFTRARRIAWAIAKAMQDGAGIFNRNGQQGLGIMKELRDQRMPAIIREEVEREIKREMAKG